MVYSKSVWMWHSLGLIGEGGLFEKLGDKFPQQAIPRELLVINE